MDKVSSFMAISRKDSEEKSSSSNSESSNKKSSPDTDTDTTSPPADENSSSPSPPSPESPNDNNGGNDNNSNDNNGREKESSNNNDDDQNNNDNYNDNNNDNNKKDQPPRPNDKNVNYEPPSTPSSRSESNGSPLKLKSAKYSLKTPNASVIAGIVLGVGVLLILLLVICCCVCKRKKKKKSHDSMHYYDYQSDQKSEYHGGQNPQQPPPWGTNQGGMHHQNMNMNYSGGMGPSSNWGPAMPPPPPPHMMSSDMSSGKYSGPAGRPMPPQHPGVSLGFNKSTFTYDELAAATGGFSNGNMIGQGGFGYVHKGVLPNGKEIAVKSLKSGSGQGDREFQAEVEIISRVHHRHLVSLVGYCVAGGQRMLVYEFIPNNTLEFHLHGKGRPVLDFLIRMRIALGSAKGLAYLHEDCHPRIIHRDIKTANILIDTSFEAKVADFGLAKLNDTNVTHVSTRVMGTFGYLAPEYAASGKLTEKSDVFSFGVMLLELVTGRRPIDASDDEDSLVDWARPLLPRAIDNGILEGLVDPKLEGNYNQQEMMRLIASAAASIRHSGKRRPKMSQIVRALEGDASLDDLDDVKKQIAAVSTNSGSQYDTVCYNNDMKHFRKMVLDSSEYTSSSDFGTTNEYKT